MDGLSREKRSWNMSRIKGKDTKIEVETRKYLFSKGFRFRKNDKRLPGNPDIVLSKYKTAVFINGCFWHQHPGCRSARLPKSNLNYWEEKLRKNVERDTEEISQLQEMGWRVIVLWECELSNKTTQLERLTKLVDEIKHI